MLSWREAVARWKAAGKPRRSSAEVERIHALCLECDQYDSKRKRCGSCGCRVNTGKWPLLNKIRMATERCPLGKWCACVPRPPISARPTIATVVTTAPRPGGSLLARCLTSLEAAGFARPLVCAEPGSHLPPKLATQADVIQRPAKLGCWQNWLQSLQDALDYNPHSQAILTVQDDVEFCRGVADFLVDKARWPSPRCGVLLVYLSSLYAAKRPPGLAPLSQDDAKDLVGACAMLFPRHVAHQLVAVGRTEGWQGHPRKVFHDPIRKVGVDSFVGRALNRLGYEVWSVNPTLANHDAKYSTVGHGPAYRNRAPIRWPGPGVDAAQAVPAPEARYTLPDGHPLVPGASPELAVVIPMAGECSDLMDSCLGHLAENVGAPARVIVIDNGTPGSVASDVRRAAKSYGLAFQLIRNETNLGFTAAVNQGLSAAGDRDVLLLNSDCRVAPNCIPLLLNTLSRFERVAAVGPMTMDHGGQSLTHGHRRDQAGPFDPNDPAGTLARNTVSEEPRLAFFCTLLSRAALEEIGPLDPALADGFGADDEWCHRAQQAGWKVVLHHGAFAVHDHSTTFRRLGIDRAAMQEAARSKVRALCSENRSK